MKLSTKGRYGLRALIDLAVWAEEDTVSIGSIAERQKISESYLEQLFRKLRKAELLISVRGAQGGYRLARPASKISVGDILRALEGNLEAVECPGLKEDGGCEEGDFCVAKYVWQRINDGIRESVDGITLEQLAHESRKSMEKKNGNAVICKN